MSAKPNLPALRARYLEAARAWREAVAARGVDLYSAAAEGRMIGRGKKRAPDDLRVLFDRHELARDAYQSGTGA